MSGFAALPPLDTEGVLWVAALDLVPIEDRVEWVKTMAARVEAINADRAAVDYSGPDDAVECGYPGCTRRVRLNPIFGGPGKQFCSKEHRDAA